MSTSARRHDPPEYRVGTFDSLPRVGDYGEVKPRPLILPGEEPDPNTHSNLPPGPLEPLTEESFREGMRRMAEHFRQADPREALRPIGLDAMKAEQERRYQMKEPLFLEGSAAAEWFARTCRTNGLEPKRREENTTT